MSYDSASLRNVTICGHGDTGKTSLCEQILYNAGVIKKAESVDTGRTVNDFTEEEIERKISIHTSISNVNWKDKKINIFDTPGISDFTGEVISAFRATESAVVLFGSRSGVQIETIKLWRQLDKRKMPRIAFITKMDKKRADYFSVIEQIKEFGVTCIPITIPIGEGDNYKGVINLLNMKAYLNSNNGDENKAIDIPEEYITISNEYHNKMIEAAAEGDDTLTEKFFENGTLELEDVKLGLREGLFENKFIPVFCGSVAQNSGITPLMDFIAMESPCPFRVEEPCITGEKSTMITPDGEFSGIIFKTSIDQFSGKLSYIKNITGTLTPNSEYYNSREEKKIKIGKIYTTEGKRLIECNSLTAGDIGVITKQDLLKTNDTLCSQNHIIHFRPLQLPQPIYSLAIEAEKKKDEDKLSELLHREAEQDKTFNVEFNPETKESVISGMGELHLEIILEKIYKSSNIHVIKKEPKIPYREAILSASSGEYTYKKQSGGHGQYGKCELKIYPLNRGENFEFVNSIKGGVISKGYMQGIEKGIKEAMEEGFLAGYPIVDVKAEVVDGKEHAVDSSELAFKMAAKNAFKVALERAKVTLLEPYHNLTVFIPEKYIGDVLSDLSSKRAKIQNQESIGGGIQSIIAQVPQAEVLKYAIDLKSITSGTGAFELEFSHYEKSNKRLN
ncbi:elongation factor G [Thiospirochaeta perfilievii]|uniref:Elongation factor G n=1 Tax=Thiospirochaeta perfilievii TaxID=252967 RepID=A0A5C1Q5A8_9SPIO|nr:elongation factor G [Thiospirochaeta perfilievii]QEN03215.1 elongation factor G [Thiospirochaeta perfilievii]